MPNRLDNVCSWEELAVEAGFKVAVMANLCGVSRRQLHRYIRAACHVSPRQFIQQMKLRQSRALQAVGLTVNARAARLGYSHASSLIRAQARMLRNRPIHVLESESPPVASQNADPCPKMLILRDCVDAFDQRNLSESKPVLEMSANAIEVEMPCNCPL